MDQPTFRHGCNHAATSLGFDCSWFRPLLASNACALASASLSRAVARTYSGATANGERPRLERARGRPRLDLVRLSRPVTFLTKLSLRTR
jgi:hypothetical protein